MGLADSVCGGTSAATRSTANLRSRASSRRPSGCAS